MDKIVWRRAGELKPFPGNPRRHPESQIAGLMKSIDLVWTNSILIDESGTILAGHCRLEAAKRLGMTEVPTITVAGLNNAEKRAVVIADNRLPERAVWDFDLLREHFRNLIEVDFAVELSGFTTGEIDLVMDGKPAASTASDPADDLTGFTLSEPAVSHLGDIWELGRHRLMCGDALRGDDYERLSTDASSAVTAPIFGLLGPTITAWP
jgi:ParB-like chromosome segregation protein Spo0J